MSVEISIARTEPVQEVAAETVTLDLLVRLLRSETAEADSAPGPLALAPLCGWPLVYDDTLPPGIVHCRPTPGAPPPLGAAETLEHFLRLVPASEGVL